MKPLLTKLAPATLFLLMLLSCTKKESVEEIKTGSSQITEMNNQISITTGQYDFLLKNFTNIRVRDSFGLHLQDSISRLPIANVTAARAGLPAEAYNPNLNENNSVFFFGYDPPEGFAMGVGSLTQYEIRPRFFFPKRENNMVVSMRFQWKGQNNDLSSPNAQFLGNPTPIITGPALGALGAPINQIKNLTNFVYRFSGNSSADVIEQRTIARTSDGKMMMKAGLDAPGMQVGAEVSAGVTIVTSVNAISDFYYSITFEFDFQTNQNTYAPKVSYNGNATCDGTQVN